MKNFFSNYRNIICVGLTILSLILTAFVFNSSFVRISESFVDLKNSFFYYLNQIFGSNLSFENTVLNYSKVEVKLPFNLPNTWEEFKVLWKNYWALFVSKENFIAYFDKFGFLLSILSRFLLIVIPIVLVVVLIRSFSSDNQNNNYNEDTKALKRFKSFEKKVLKPIKMFFVTFIEHIKENPYWKTLWIIIWCWNFNFFVILVEFFSYYFYFVGGFDFVSIYIQVVKLLADLCTMINFIPVFGWIIIGLVLINKKRRKIGYELLEHKEMCNRGFINERPIVLMVCGTMGKKKTTMITDIALSEEIMLRDKAFEKILEADLKFPNFPWINLENAIKKAMENHSIYNLSTCKRFIHSKLLKFNKNPNKRNIFGYDFLRYGVEIDNKLFSQNIWEVLSDYTQLYFIYIIQSSLLISNYSIRVDNVLNSVGNFPLWDTDLFRRNNSLLASYSRHSHILDFDSLRLGKKLIDDNEYKDSFEFGVINITEIGKERGNNLELQELKKKTDEANQKNDLFNSWLKLVRHSATVDNFPFVKVIVDEQRPESWGADARDLCEIVFIDECSDLTLAMPLFNLGTLFFNWWKKKFVNKYYEYRFNRGDNTLPMYLYHNLTSIFMRYYNGIYNTFGYYTLNCLIESGRQDKESKKSKYFLMCKKIYSKRFSTDCFSDYFYEKTIRSKLGLDDIDEYKTEKASFEELMKENSYFFNDLMKLRNNDK